MWLMWLPFLLATVVACTRPEQPQPFVWHGRSQATVGEETQLTAWTIAQEPPDWQGLLLAKATEATANENIITTITGYNIAGQVYRQRVGAAAEAGTGPDIAYIDHIPTFIAWSEAGYLWPLDQCRATHAEFDNVQNEWWPDVTWRDQVWAVPVDIEVQLLFYSKDKLRALGWSDERIQHLPERITRGEFTLDDLVATARQAIAAGVVEPGFGYWQRPGKRITTYHHALGGQLFDAAGRRSIINPDILEQTYTFWQQMILEELTTPFVLNSNGDTWSSRAVWHDVIIHERVLFWYTSTNDWAKWTLNYLDHHGGETYLRDKVGYALFPSGVPGVPGSSNYHWTGFVILSENASGRQHQEAACAVLAQTVTPLLNVTYPAQSGRLSVVKPELLPLDSMDNRFTADNQYTLEYTWVSPYPILEQQEIYRDILAQFADEVAQGTLSPAEAAAMAVQELDAALGDALVIE